MLHSCSRPVLSLLLACLGLSWLPVTGMFGWRPAHTFTVSHYDAGIFAKNGELALRAYTCVVVDERGWGSGVTGKAWLWCCFSVGPARVWGRQRRWLPGTESLGRILQLIW